MLHRITQRDYSTLPLTLKNVSFPRMTLRKLMVFRVDKRRVRCRPISMKLYEGLTYLQLAIMGCFGKFEQFYSTNDLRSSIDFVLSLENIQAGGSAVSSIFYMLKGLVRCLTLSVETASRCQLTNSLPNVASHSTVSVFSFGSHRIMTCAVIGS